MNKPATRAIGAAELHYVSDELIKAEVDRRVRSGDWSHFLGHAKTALYGEDLNTVDEYRMAEEDHGVQVALEYWRRGDKREALHKLEQALGSDWHGLSDIRPEELQ